MDDSTNKAEVQWGREIPVNGVRPGWLGDDVPVKGFEEDGREFLGSYAAQLLCWSNHRRIRLPADHFAYKALDAGFEPWGGGDEAPGDWDKGILQCADGFQFDGSKAGELYWDRRGAMGDIIGYHKRSVPSFDPAPHLATYDPATHVVVRKMTEGEAEGMLSCHIRSGSIGYRWERVVNLLRHMGVIKEEPSEVDIFMQEHPDADRRTAELMAAAGWGK